MSTGPELRTERLCLRRWKPDDLDAFAGMNADTEVMEYFPSTLSPEEGAAFVERIEQNFEDHGYGMWAVEATGMSAFIGFVGLAFVGADFPCGPTVEIGWRLARSYWGHGYATEAALASLDFAFSTLDLEEVVAFTVPNNHRSRSVMERLGMVRDPRDDFDHPRVPPGHALRRHVLYRLRKTNSVSPVSM